MGNNEFEIRTVSKPPSRGHREVRSNTRAWHKAFAEAIESVAGAGEWAVAKWPTKSDAGARNFASTLRGSKGASAVPLPYRKFEGIEVKGRGSLIYARAAGLKEDRAVNILEREVCDVV